jgi:3-oxoacyl-[acyl-carrier protein] reductase
MDLGLTGTGTLVAGASRGIGLATARAFLAEGADVAVVARGQDRLVATRDELAAQFPGRRVVAVRGDMRNPDDVETVIQTAIGEFGRLDSVIANAGKGVGRAGWELDARDWRDMLDENFLTAAYLCRAAATVMESGALVLVGSIAGLGHLAAPLPYSAAKAALVRYGKDLARALASRNVRVNVVAPGNVLFPGGRWEDLIERDRAGVEAYVSGAVPMARFGTPEEVASAIVFLCSQPASFVTGACLTVDGGQLGD